jgi:hypothetical protein
MAEIKWLFQDIEKTGGHRCMFRGGARKLPASHAEVEIVQHHEGEVYISPASSKKMRSSYSQSTITHGYYDFKVRLHQLDPSCIGKSAAMETMKCMGIEKGVKKPGAPNITHDNHFTASEAHLLESPVQDMDTAIVGATGAKNWGTMGVKEAIHPTPPQ